MFETLEDMVRSTAEAVRPPERLTVAEAAEKYRYLNNRGAYVGQWRNDMVPPMIEPMEVLTDLDFTGEIFVGPSQASKTELYLNFHLYTVRCDPSDLMLVECTQNRASDFSKRRIDRLHQHSDLDQFLLPQASADNIHDKRYRNGAMVNVAWPTSTHLSGRPIPRLFFTDYDRMPMDVDGEGSPYDLGTARATTFGRYGMVVAESSPSFPILDPNWVPQSPHEAPPCDGILALYNRGDRRRWYWPCIKCGNAFEPTFALLVYDERLSPMDAGERAKLRCPHCAFEYTHEPGAGQPGKHELNRRGFWLRDGESWRKDLGVIGEPRRSRIASFWLKGEAAPFKTWATIVEKYLMARNEYLSTGEESALKTTTNTDQAMPYVPKAHESERVPEMLRSRAFDYGQKVVPDPVRFLVAAVDVQKFRFVVQVLGVSRGGDLWVIDRWDLKYSERMDEDYEGEEERVSRVQPFVYKEDWRLLLRHVMAKAYPLADGSGRHMAVRLTVGDSGGGDRATANAYAFWRWLRAGPGEDEEADWPEWSPGMQNRFRIFRGTSTSTVQARTQIRYPDSGRMSRFAGARGEIPVLWTNVTPIKNQLDSMLNREDEETGKVNFAQWLPINFYKELCVETLDPQKNIWVNPRNFRNESWDLFVMALAGLIEQKLCNWEKIDWDDPPSWAREWDDNDMVFDPVEHDSPVHGERKVYDFSRIAEELG